MVEYNYCSAQAMGAAENIDEADQIEAEAQQQNNIADNQEERKEEEELIRQSVPIRDASLQRLYDWVRQNGGLFNCESRAHVATGVRGLYASKDLTDPNEPIIQIPSKLIVSPYHISNRNIAEWHDGKLQYETIFE